MKKIILYLILFPLVLFSKEKELPSKISKVTVYLSGAQVMRKANVFLSPGTTELRLNGLSPVADENSIRYSGLKSASVLASKYTITYAYSQEDSKEIARLKKILTASKLHQNTCQNQISGLKQELELLYKNQLLWNEKEISSLDKLKNFSAYYRQRIPSIQNDIYKHQLQIDSLENIQNKLESELNTLTSKHKEAQGVLLLKLYTDVPQKLNLSIAYNVSHAGWFPVYDLKTENPQSPLKIHYKAHVYQETGEDWNQVQLVLSTADPNIQSELPKLEPHFLNFINPYAHRSKAKSKNNTYKYNPFVKKVTGVITDNQGPLPGVNVLIKGTSYGTVTDFDGRYSLEIPEGEQLTVSYVGYIAQEIPIYASIMNISLDEDAQMLEEVVVTAYSNAGRVSGIADQVAKKKELVYVIDGRLATEEEFYSLDPSEIANTTPLDPGEAMGIYGSQASGGAMVVTTKQIITKQNMTSKEFTIREKHTIPSLLDVTVIGIETHSVTAAYEYYTAPVLNESVFLTANLTNWEALDLLPGEANIYFAGSYSGKTLINPYISESKMVISLGPDPGITVRRKQVNNFKNKSFTGGARIVYRAYDIALRNNKKHTIAITVMDRIPISQNREIKVDHIEQEADNYDRKKGLLTWKIKVKPGQDIKKRVFPLVSGIRKINGFPFRGNDRMVLVGNPSP